MPGSPTTPGRPGTRARAPVRVAFRDLKRVGTRNSTSFAAQWLACALPYRRFAVTLAGANARLGAEVVRFAFLVEDLHPLLLAGLPAHSDQVFANTCDGRRWHHHFPAPGAAILNGANRHAEAKRDPDLDQ